QRRDLDRPPAVQRQRKNAGDDKRHDRREEPRFDSSCQRVRHLFTALRKPYAAYFAPASVSAAGYAHWAAIPARASVRSSFVRAGTVESEASTIQSPWVSGPCSATSCASSG